MSSYTALARKWLPRSFAEMTGQEHVLRALANALADATGVSVHHIPMTPEDFLTAYTAAEASR